MSFEHSSSAPAPVYGPDMDPRDMTALHFTTQLCFFPPWKEVIPFVSVQLKYTNHPSRSNIVKVRHWTHLLRCGAIHASQGCKSVRRQG